MAKNSAPPVILFQPFSVEELADAHVRGAAAAETQKETFHKLGEICRAFNQIELLSRLAMVTIGGLSKFGSPNFNPSLQLFELEIFQAIALSTNLKEDWSQSAISLAIEQVIGLLRDNSTAFKNTSLLKLSGDAEKDKVAAIIDRMRITTLSVRGARHAFQTRAYVRDLAKSLDGRFQDQLGFTVSDLVSFFEDTGFRIDRELEGLRSKSRRWMAANNPAKCLALFREDNPTQADHPLVVDVAPKVTGMSEMMGTLFAVFEEELKHIFQIDRGELEKSSNGSALWEAFSHISLRFGDVPVNMIDHLHLSNPVVTKPFVSDGSGNYYLFCAQTAFANMIEVLEVMASQQPKLSESIEKFKAGWLETKLNSIVAAAFPSGRTHAQAEWHDAEGKEGETDCILLLDKTVGLFEAKSGRITPPARRGASDRLKREITKLLVEPSRQSERFARLLQHKKGSVGFKTPEGCVEIAASDVREVFRINVLFDTIGPLSTATKRLSNAGFIAEGEPMAPSMSIFELETLLDILPDQISKIHYLRRRVELERNALIEADEMDLIAFYLETGFQMGDLESSENGFSIYGWSDRVATMFDHEGRREKTDIRLRRTPAWSRLLQAIENTGETGWTRFGYRLCEVSYTDQWSIQKVKEQTIKKARKLKPGQAIHTGVYTAGENALMPIAICVGKQASSFDVFGQSEQAARVIMDLAGTDDALLLYWDCAEADLPYKFIATFQRASAGKLRGHRA